VDSLVQQAGARYAVPVIQARMKAMLLNELLACTVKQKGFFDFVDFVAISASLMPAALPQRYICCACAVVASSRMERRHP
jgi:N-acetylglutamate synthase-like GNAT family acetyltransferase